jgi:hypothetical protein
MRTVRSRNGQVLVFREILIMDTKKRSITPIGEKRAATSPDIEVSPGTAEYSIDPEVEKRVLRKIDMFVMPMMCLVFFTQCKFAAVLLSDSR